MGCSIWRWYPAKDRKPAFSINSVVEGSITLIETPKKKKNGENEYNVRIITYELEKRREYFECAVDDHARQVLEKETEYHPDEKEAEHHPDGEAWHYGLIIVKPGQPNLADSIVKDFISFHRHPVVDTEKPTSSRYGISTYNEVFETRADKEKALKKLDPKKAKQSAKKVTEEGLSQRDAEDLKKMPRLQHA